MKPPGEVLERFRAIPIDEEFDLIVAVANGGIVPAGILNQRLHAEVRLLYINLRDERQQPVHDAPRVLHPVDFDVKGKRVLLVDDRVKTGATLATARELLREAARVRTFAVNGRADYALYDEPCFAFPWIL
ncbi:MAG: phosphoribosyltransferase [Odoribacteraceae bacterium]|jgi:hypoxanthine phosphoribosyltransferase|nr:phosphoribosyltransferase [Odoribacteraceae bacterium]